MAESIKGRSRTVSRRKDPMLWIQEQIENDVDPQGILIRLIPKLQLPMQVSELSLWKIIFEILSEPPRRKILPHINSIDQVKCLIRESRNIVVLTGAGVSVSCGIPDFRSRDGIYARLHNDFPDLPDPQSMFDIHYFKSNQRPFFKFAKEIYPGQFTPSLCHRFIAHLDQTGRLLRNYSQNIDTLEQVAGIKNVVQCHGSFATASCMNCKHKVNAEEIKENIFQEQIPYCPKCVVKDEDEMNVLKPDIVFFGESLPEAFHRQIEFDKDKADLLIVIGSSLKVRPVSLIPNLLNSNVPQILINREPLDHFQFDVEFYGNCDDVIAELCEQLGDEWLGVNKSFERKPLNSEKVQKIFNDAAQFSSKDQVEDSAAIKTSETVPIISSNKSSADHSVINKPSDNISVVSDTKSLNPTTDTSETTESTNSVTNCQCVGGNSYGCSCNIPFEHCSEDCDRIKSETASKEEQKLKRKCDCGKADDVAIKKVKFDSNEDLFYLHIPPNRYIFHGAELHLDEDSDSESDSDIENINLSNEIDLIYEGEEEDETESNKPSSNQFVYDEYSVVEKDVSMKKCNDNKDKILDDSTESSKK